MATSYDEFGNVIYSDVDPGESTVTPLQLDYYRQKIVEFQGVLTQLDEAASASDNILNDFYDADPELSAYLQSALSEYDLKKGTFRTAAEALNFAISGVNSIGANFPTVAIPSGLGLVPLAAAAGVAGALAVAAGLVVWGRDWIAGVNQRLNRAQVLEAVTDPAQKAELARELARIESAAIQANDNPLSSIAGAVKWIGLAALAWFAFTAYKQSR